MTEGFEAYSAGSLPCLPTPTFTSGCTSEGGLTHTFSGGANSVTTAAFDAGAKSFLAGSNSRFRATGTDLCEEPISVAVRGIGGTGTLFTLSGVVPGTEGAGTSSNRITVEVNTGSVGAAATANFRFGRYQNSGSETGGVTSNQIQFTASLSATAWYHFAILCPDGATAGTVAMTITEATALGSGFASVAAGANSGTSFQVTQYFSMESGKYYDNLQTVDPTPTTPGSPFCANPSEANFGYDYVGDGVSYEDGIVQADISFNDAFLFTGDDDESGMVAKGYNPGTKAFMVRFRIEASLEGVASKFRVAFTTGDTVLTAGASQDAGPSGADFLATGENNGEDGGNFDENVQIHVVENDDQWNLRAYYNTGSGLVQLPQTVNYGANPNTPTTFQVVVNSGLDGDLPDSIDGHPIPFIGDTAIGIQDGEGNSIFSWGLPLALHNAEWKDQWFIGQGTNAFDAFTYIDDQEQQTGEDSTCVWDLIGTGTRTGSGGLVPGSQVPPPQETPDEEACSAIFCPPASGIGGLSSSALSLFLGIVIVASFAASMSSSTGTGAGGLAIFALLGVFIGYALGYIQLWVVLVLFTIGLGAIFLGFHNGGKSEGM